MSEYARRIDIQVTIDLWDWPSGRLTETIDITNDLKNYRFQKSIKNPQGSCQISMLPQSTTTHILDIVKPLDVIRIYEFGTLKFVGYVRRMSYSGSIGKDGTPERDAVLTAQQFGGLLMTAAIGFGLGTALGVGEDPILNAAAQLSLDILNAVQDGTSFAEVVGLIYDSFITFINSIDATQNFASYLEHYINTEAGLNDDTSPLLPRQPEFFNGTEQQLTFWQVVEQLIEKPFNEMWIDNGPRKVRVGSKDVDLPAKSCLVFRPTPFNKRLSNGVETNDFDSIPAIHVDKNHFIRFDLSRGLDEVYTAYSVKSASFRLDDIPRLLLGEMKVDYDRVGKYLFKPLITELFFTRIENTDGDSVELPNSRIQTVTAEAAETLLNWFSANEEYLSGAISHMVPTDPDADPKIGDKISVYAIEGFFYVEGIAHTWNYGGALQSTASVTRGYNRTQKIELKDRVFKRSLMS
jgi:hypothetical protein